MATERLHGFNNATVLLLSRVTGVDAALLRAVELRPREHNWLRAPWFGEDPGGAMVLGNRIYLTQKLYRAPLSADRGVHLQWLLLMAHEVVHVQQARRFGAGAMARTGFVLWAAVHYMRSFLRNGTKAYRQAGFEQEAEAGRITLRHVLQRTGGITPTHPAVRMAVDNDGPGIQRWLDDVLPDQGRTTNRPVHGVSPST